MDMSPKTVCFWIALLSSPFPSRANDSPLDRNTLRGLMAFNVVVDEPEQELQDRGLTAAAVETEVEQHLLRAGLHVDKNAYEFVGIQIRAAHAKKTDFALCITLAVYQAVSLKRDPSIASATPTWSVESVLLVPPKQIAEAWMDGVDELIGQFVTAWGAVNSVRQAEKGTAGALNPDSHRLVLARRDP
jgi:hypothetical protein